MSPRQARRERREAERKAKKLELKKSRLAEKHPLSAVEEYPEIQPRWNPELEDEFPREVQIRNNAITDRWALRAGLPIPPPGPSPAPSIESLREHLLARRTALLAKEPAADINPAPDVVIAADVLAVPTEPNPSGVQTSNPTTNTTKAPLASLDGFVSQNASSCSLVSRAETNRANAQLSTGPRTAAGKLASSRNSLKHGLASGQVLIPGEDPAAFASLLTSLLDEHQPAAPTEQLLIEEMAQSHWLAQRAIRLQNDCFTESGVNEKQLALFLRYQTTHQRAFFKALSTLMSLKKEAARARRGFVSQRAPQASEFVRQNGPQTEFVSQNDSPTAASSGFVSQNVAPSTAAIEFVSQNARSSSSQAGAEAGPQAA